MNRKIAYRIFIFHIIFMIIVGLSNSHFCLYCKHLLLLIPFILLLIVIIINYKKNIFINLACLLSILYMIFNITLFSTLSFKRISGDNPVYAVTIYVIVFFLAIYSSFSYSLFLFKDKKKPLKNKE